MYPKFGVYDYGCNLWWDCKLLVRRPTLGKCKSWIGRLQEGERCTTGGQTNKSRDDRNKELGLNFINCSASRRIHFFKKQHAGLFLHVSGSNSRVSHSFWFYVDSFHSKSDHCLALAVTTWWSYLGNVVKSSKAKFRWNTWLWIVVCYSSNIRYVILKVHAHPIIHW